MASVLLSCWWCSVAALLLAPGAGLAQGLSAEATQALLALVDRLPADEVDLWSCSKAFRRDLVDRFAAIGVQLRAVEIGSYRGSTTLVLSHLFSSVVTVDVNRTLLGVARARARGRVNVRYVLADTTVDPWWTAPGDAEVLLVDGAHDYQSARSDLDLGLEHLASLRWVILDDYGSLGDPARVVEESLSRGDFIDCEPLGRRSGERLPRSDIVLNGPEAVLCSVRQDRASGRVEGLASRTYFGSSLGPEPQGGRGVLALHGRVFEVCLAPCEVTADLARRSAGVLNFTEREPEAPSGAAPARGGTLHFSAFRGGGRGVWRQFRPGASFVAARYKMRSYYFFWASNLMGFQAHELNQGAAAAGSAGEMVFKAVHVSRIASDWLGGLG